MTKFELMQVFFQKGACAGELRGADGITHKGFLVALERESGSGSSFNATMLIKHDNPVTWETTYERRSVFVRTID
jgi:hypothetical protein